MPDALQCLPSGPGQTRTVYNQIDVAAEALGIRIEWQVNLASYTSSKSKLMSSLTAGNVEHLLAIVHGAGRVAALFCARRRKQHAHQ